MFDDPSSFMWLIPVLPLAASVVTAFFGPRLLRQHSHWPCILGAALAFGLSALLLVGVVNDQRPVTTYYTWFLVPGSDTTNQVIVTPDPSKPSVFFKLVYP